MPTVVATPNPGDATVVVAGSGFATRPVTVTRTSGGVSQVVRGGSNLTPSAGSLTVVDGECPFDVDVRYEVTDPGPPAVITTSNTIRLDSGDTGWLSHPGYVDLRLRIYDETADDWTYTAHSTAHTIVDRADPVVTAAPTDLGSGTLTFRVVEGDLSTLTRMFADGWPTLYRGSCSNIPDRWMLVESYRAHVIRRDLGTREISASFRVVLRPADEPYVVSPWRLIDVDALFGTMSQVDAAYTTMSQVDAGPPT